MTSELRNAWGDYLAAFDWSHYLTLTSRFPSSPRRLLGEFQTFVRRLERMTQCKVQWFAVVEGAWTEFPHVHALVAGAERLRTPQLERWWKQGYTRVRRYDSARGAAYYVTKAFGRMDRDWDDYDFSFPAAGPIESRRVG